jgi:hypothetical protein
LEEAGDLCGLIIPLIDLSTLSMQISARLRYRSKFELVGHGSYGAVVLSSFGHILGDTNDTNVLFWRPLRLVR